MKYLKRKVSGSHCFSDKHLQIVSDCLHDSVSYVHEISSEMLTHVAPHLRCFNLYFLRINKIGSVTMPTHFDKSTLHIVM